MTYVFLLGNSKKKHRIGNTEKAKKKKSFVTFYFREITLILLQKYVIYNVKNREMSVVRGCYATVYIEQVLLQLHVSHDISAHIYKKN